MNFKTAKSLGRPLRHAVEAAKDNSRREVAMTAFDPKRLRSGAVLFALTFPQRTCDEPHLVFLTPLWPRTAHVVPLRMVRCGFPKLRYGRHK
jgi:hypothetical protein